MRNVWIQTEPAFATWVADLSALRTEPRALLDVVAAILDAGARHRVFVPVELPELGYQRGAAGALAERLEAQWRDDRVVDLFGFTGAAMAPGAGSSTVEAEVAWFDRDGAIAVGPTTDLGAVLRAHEPGVARCFAESYPPVRIVGPSLAFGDDGPLDDVEPPMIAIALHSDLWQPYVFGSGHPAADHVRHFDNRALAERHTPRLNAFLREVAAAVVTAGGTFAIDPGESSTDTARWLDARGIDLDAPPPALFPPDPR